MPPSKVPETLIVPETEASPLLVGHVVVGPPPPLVGVGVGDVVRVGVGVGEAVLVAVGLAVVGVVLPSVVTVTSSKLAVEYPVCRPTRPVEATELVPEPTDEPSIE